MKLKLLLFSFLCADAFAASQMVPTSIAWLGFPQNQSPAPSFACLVSFIAEGPGWGAQCLGTAVCTPGSAFSRQTITTSAAVEEFCPFDSGAMHLEAKGQLLLKSGMGASAFLSFSLGGIFNRHSVFHDSYDDCNQAAPYHNNPMDKPCPHFK